jgi:RNA 2',3'-cyclic 3'-phosphodiesterase
MARDRASRPEAKALRLFVAFDVSAEAAEEVESAIDPWRSAFPKARWVPNENWHITVKFLGQTWPRLEEWVRERVRDAASGVGPVATRLAGLGCFPSPGRARVLWVGLDDRPGRLAEIALALDAALATEFTPETRAFSPHLTVARSDPPLRLPAAFGETAMEPVAFRVDRLTLYRSHLRRPAPRYEPLATFPLGG